MKTIGITTRYMENENLEFVRSEYLNYVSNYFTPIIISSSFDTNLLNLCDCFLIPGGDDINIKYYSGLGNHNNNYVDDRIDKLDKSVIEYALISKKPLLGICRGIQAINVFLGGTLIEDIEDGSHKKVLYNDILSFNGKGNFFNNIFKDDIKINSYHHQAIDKLAPDLIYVATSRGIVEALEHRSLPIYAVQWHPEKLDDDASKKIIEAFKDVVYENKK